MVSDYISTVAELIEQTPRRQLRAIEHVLWSAYQHDATLFVCGNGGSAATASHFACDLSKWTVHKGSTRVRAIALTDNVPLMTAWSNDYSYTEIFVEQLRNLYKSGDVLIAISGSGNSPNVLNAVEWMHLFSGTTIAITGFGGGRLAQIAQHALIVPSECMPQVEDAHMAICHSLAVNLGRLIAEQN